ncbi:hypothetical protein [Oceanicoccus sp. KOV_DT_Chl]|uniref:hypothetical protein n=1 Tax=Oceanicoccus sp. KOV_DT_Chl TaxID=1904639 RepID=UPI002101123E|nr:hypothetical protein [Oceanicoccus sp. KOV_DT_Chl]
MVEGFITEPIERIAATVPGVDFIDSNTTAGMSTVNVWLKLNQNSTDALSELSSRLSQIRFELPTGRKILPFQSGEQIGRSLVFIWTYRLLPA